jgi:RNA polymerase sigma-70 factor (ECF subfamily)
MIAEGLALIDQAMQRRAPGAYQIKAAISACHCQPEGSDWAQIVLLYDSLLRIEPTPVVQLSRAVALAEAGWLDVALHLLDALQPQLRDYQPYHAANADLLARAGKKSEALGAYDRAIMLASSAADIAYLRERAGRAVCKIG